MTIEVKSQVIRFAETVSVEEAEKLLEVLIKKPTLPINLKRCKHMHTAVLQVLLRCQPPIKELPDNPEFNALFTQCFFTNEGVK